MSVGKAIVWGVLALALTSAVIRNFLIFNSWNIGILIVLAVGSWAQTVIEAKDH